MSVIEIFSRRTAASPPGVDFIEACAGMDITQLHKVNIYLQPGTFRIDNIRAE